MEHLSIIYLIFSTHDVQLIWKQYFQLNSHAYTCTKINYIAGEHYWWALLVSVTGMVVCFFSGPEHQQTDPSSLSDCLEYPLQNGASSRYIERCKVRSENGGILDCGISVQAKAKCTYNVMCLRFGIIIGPSLQYSGTSHNGHSHKQTTLYNGHWLWHQMKLLQNLCLINLPWADASWFQTADKLCAPN